MPFQHFAIAIGVGVVEKTSFLSNFSILQLLLLFLMLKRQVFYFIQHLVIAATVDVVEKKGPFLQFCELFAIDVVGVVPVVVAKATATCHLNYAWWSKFKVILQ